MKRQPEPKPGATRLRPTQTPRLPLAHEVVAQRASTVAPHLQPLHALLARLAALVAQRRDEALPPLVAEAVVSHLSRGICTSRRALAMPPTRDGLVLTIWATDAVRATIALLEEWSSS